MVAVAQLVRVPGCGPGGRGFESHQPPHLKTLRKADALRILISQKILGRRQAVRHGTLTPALAGSNPAVPAKNPTVVKNGRVFYFILFQCIAVVENTCAVKEKNIGVFEINHCAHPVAVNITNINKCDF